MTRFSDSGVLASLLGSRAVVVETFEALAACPQPEEARNAERMSPARRQEFATGRACARLALESLGVKAESIRQRFDRVPEWPRGVVGSITHCPGFYAAAVSRSSTISGLGIDAEPISRNDRMPLHRICGPDELEHALLGKEAPSRFGNILRFVAKESAYKCLFPDLPDNTGFSDVVISFDINNFFKATVDLEGQKSILAIGRWAIRNNLAFAAAIPNIDRIYWNRS